MGLYHDKLVTTFRHIFLYCSLVMMTMLPPLSDGLIVREYSFLRVSRASSSSLERLPWEVWDFLIFNFLTSDVVDAMNAAKLGLVVKGGNLSDFFLNFLCWSGHNGTSFLICSSKRFSISIVSMRSLGSCSSRRVRRSSSASSALLVSVWEIFLAFSLEMVLL